MIKKIMDSITEMQESILHEINSAMNDFNCGRSEEGYDTLKNLKDELQTDILISKESDKTEQFEKVIELGVKKYAENEYKKS